MEFIANFFDMVHHFLTVDLQTIGSRFLVKAGMDLIEGYLKFKLIMLGISVQIAQSLFAELSTTQVVQDAYNSLDSRTLNMAAFFGIPTAIKNIIVALITRFVLSFTGW